MRKIENPRQIAKDVQPGTIIRPFADAERFDVERAETTTWGETRFWNWHGEMVRMSDSNYVEILGHFNPDNA